MHDWEFTSHMLKGYDHYWFGNAKKLTIRSILIAADLLCSIGEYE